MNDTIFIANKETGKIHIWRNHSIQPTKTIFANLSSPASIFVTELNEIYVDNGENGRVNKWQLDSNISTPVIYVNSSCTGLFIDISHVIYCSMQKFHQVISQRLYDNSSILTIVAGTGKNGSNSTMLQDPYGIFVDTNSDLYVADCGNDRIQRFHNGLTNGITVVGNRSVNITIMLNCPRGVVLDADKSIFIVDSSHHRVVVSGPNGSHCLVGCSMNQGSSANELSIPRTLSFDIYGNMFVADTKNNRIQKFLLIKNSCVEHTTQQLIHTSTIQAVSVQSSFKSLQSTLSTPEMTTFQQNATTKQRTTFESTAPTTSFTMIAVQKATSQNPTYETSSTKNLNESTASISINQFTATYTFPSPMFFISSSCGGNYQIGLHCNISATPCDILQPCQNDGICFNNISNATTYTCSCKTGFNGTHCQINYQPCKVDTCWNNGTCNETTLTTFECLCQPGWTENHCERQINYCENVKCSNGGICRPLFRDYVCECLGTSYSGRHCELVANLLYIRRIVSKSVGYIALLSIIGVFLLVIILDILKYFFKIDPAKHELEKLKRKQQEKNIKRVLMIQKCVYVNVPSKKITTNAAHSIINRTGL
ncbi:hypothetical protein I4U23_019855 [Adineta vaga]|nr:hypothetical protein I4U23_019855 [Adineta vaga]